jgi:iron complex outermembrane receptor protein
MNKKLIFTLVAASFSASALAEGINLNPIVITATRSAQNSFDLPVSIDAVDAETLHDSRVMANLSEVSARIPGVVINNRYNSAQELAISTRGFGARSLFGVKGVRIYADGIPLTTPDGQGQLGALSLDTASQIEFMRGPFSALYGNSSGGVVQAITRDGAKDTTLSGGISIGKYNTYRESLTAEGQAGYLNYIMNVTNITSDGYRDHSKFKKENFNSKLSYKFSDDTKLTLIANYMNQPYTEDPQALSPSLFKQNPRQAISTSYTGNTRVERDQTFGGLVLDHNFSDTQSLRLMTYYGERNNLQYLPTSASGYSRTFGGFDARWTSKNELFNRPLTFSAGINYDSMTDDDRIRWTTSGGVKTAQTRNEVQKAHNFDQFAQVTFEPTDRWLLLAGLRHSNIKMNVKDNFLSDGNQGGALSYSNTSPALGATFKLTPALNLYANYGEGFETPTFAEMSYSSVNGIDKGAGPNLAMQPSKSKNYEVGAKAFVTENTRVNLALFKVNATNEITVADNNSTDNITSYKSEANTERKGIELSIDSRLPYNFNFYGAYTLMDAEFKNTFCPASSCSGSNASKLVKAGNKISATYTSTQYSELSWKYPQYGFSTALEAIYASSTNAYDTNDSTYKADSYYLFNVRAGLTQNVGNWRVNEYARVDNMFDESYVSNVKVNSTSSFEPGQSRNYTIGVSASYVFK